MYFLDKEKDYSPFAMCFDPIVYLTSLNRVTFRVYNFLLEHGVRVEGVSAPTDPYLVQRIAAPIFWLSVVLHICFFGGLFVWTFIVEHDPPLLLVVTNIIAAVLILFIPNLWNYRAVIGKRGFPRSEPLGAYTVGYFATNRLSLIGY